MTAPAHPTTSDRADPATEWFTPRAVARMLGLPYEHVLARFKSGRFPAIRAGTGDQRQHFRCNFAHIEQIQRILAEGDPPPPAAQPERVDPLQEAIEATRRQLGRHPGPRKR